MPLAPPSRRLPAPRVFPLLAAAVLGLVALAGVVALPVAAFAQGFHAVTSKDGNDVWAVGDAGTWYRSFNAGADWTSGSLGDKALRGVAARGLVVIAVGDSGKVWRSADNGGTWALAVLPGAPDLKAVEFPSDTVAYVCGAGDALYRSGDGGVSWSARFTAGPGTLNGLRFRDELNGWTVGSGGRAFVTSDGGANWTARPTATARELLAVDFIGADVWAVGAYAVAFRSSTGGASWFQVDLMDDALGDVRAVWMTSASQVTLTGGGGYIRTSTDGGFSWSFATHPLLAPASDYFAVGSKAWVVARGTRAVLRTSNGGTSWALGNGTTTTYDWQLKQAAGAVTVRGNTFAFTPQNRDLVFCVMGPNVYKSWNRGDTWTLVHTIPSVIKVNSFYVSPKDTMRWIAAVGTPDRIMVTSNGGGSWSSTIFSDFTEYGMPFEMNPDRTDTLLFGPENGRLYRTQNFGASWDTLSIPGFRSPCDLVITPNNNLNVVVGDGVTGVGLAKIWQSDNGGLTFADRYTGASSETPTLWSSRLGNKVIFAANWSSGGVWRSTDFGVTWSQVTTVTSAWGGATAGDDPTLVTFNRYAGSPNYISFDGGTSFTSTALTNPGSGYALANMDRSTILDMHSGGIFKLVTTYVAPASNTQSLTLTTPNGGEAWNAGSSHSITWTGVNLGLVNIEYRRSPSDPWVGIAVVEGAAGSYAWTVPNDPTTTAEVRVSDAWDGSPVDVSNATFTILAPRIQVTPSALAFGGHATGSAVPDSVRVTNTGTATLTVSSITTATAAFTPGRASLTLAAGASDTVGVTFRPTLVQAYTDTLVLVSDGGAPVKVALSGTGTGPATATLLAPNGGEAWPVGSLQNVTWTGTNLGTVSLDYRVSDVAAWVPIAAALPASPGTFAWAVPNTPTTTARVRVRDTGGAVEDASDLVFAITAALFAIAPDSLDFGVVPANVSAYDTVRVTNGGTAPLSVTNVTSNNGAFVPLRTAFTLAAGASDSLGFLYTPSAQGAVDTAQVTFVTDEPASPHRYRLRGTGGYPVAVEKAPVAFAFEAPRPNPFAGRTTLRYALPVRSAVRLEVFDLAGRRVATLVRAEQEPGQYAVTFDPRALQAQGGRALTAGVYFVRLHAAGFERTHKLLYMAQ